MILTIDCNRRYRTVDDACHIYNRYVWKLFGIPVFVHWRLVCIER